MNGFKQFLLRGNVVDMAVGIVVGAAFGTVVTSFVKDLLTPFIAAVIHAPDFSSIVFKLNGSKFLIGRFHQRSGIILHNRDSSLFRRCPSHQRTGSPCAETTASRPYDQEMSGMYKRDSDPGEKVRILHLGAFRIKPRSCANCRAPLIPGRAGP
jgi:hypothetical protein